MKKLVAVLAGLLLAVGLAQMDLSTPGGESVVVSFTSDPPGAEVYVADTFIGTTPTSVRINRGRRTPYRVLVQDPAYQPFEGTLEFQQDEAISVYVPRAGAPTGAASLMGPVGPQAARWARSIFEKIGIISVECPANIERGVCGMTGMGPTFVVEMWDAYDDLGGYGTIPVTPWRYANGAVTKLFSIGSEFAIVALNDEVVFVAGIYP